MKTYKFPIYPSASQLKELDHWSYLYRQVYNACIEQRLNWGKRFKELTGKSMGANHQSAEITQLRREIPVFAKVPSDVLANAAHDADLAMAKWFDEMKKGDKSKGRPRFRSRYDSIALCFDRGESRGVKVKKAPSGSMRLFGFPKIGSIRIRPYKPIDGEIRTVALKNDDGKWYACLTVKIEIVAHAKPGTSVGVDLGVTRSVQLSNGEYFNLPADLIKEIEERKKVLQRRHSRKTRGSKNSRKAYRRIAKLDERIARIRKANIDMIVTRVSKDFETVVVENLKVRNMTRSAKGTVEEPGKNVAAKSGLNKSILRHAPSMVIQRFVSKTQELGGTLVKVDPRYTSQTCSACGYVDPLNRESQSEFECKKCGFQANADLNAATNVLHRAPPREAPVETSPLGESVKQETNPIPLSRKGEGVFRKKRVVSSKEGVCEDSSVPKRKNLRNNKAQIRSSSA